MLEKKKEEARSLRNRALERRPEKEETEMKCEFIALKAALSKTVW